MEKSYKIGRLATLKQQLKQLVKDVQEGKKDKEKAADEILILREEIDNIIRDLNSIEHN
jgi:hypothetical protein